MRMSTVSATVLVLFTLCYCCLCQDPCDTAHPFVVDVQRDPSHATEGVPICDTVPVNWYRVKGPGEIDLDITQETPSLSRCNTQYPMWLDGTLPTGGTEVDVSVCTVGLGNSCASRQSIRVKDCGHFRVYRLLQPNSCPSGYCFDVTVPTAPPADPTCPPNVLTIDGLPVVMALVADSDDPELRINGTDLVLEELQFRCDITNPRDDLFYDVKWYINGLRLGFEQRALPGTNISSAILREQHWRSNFKMGMRVACSVAVREDSNCNSGAESRSNDFFAGITVTATSLTMEETDPPQTVTYTCTVPIPCFHKPGRPSATCYVQLDASGQSSPLGCPVAESTSNNIQTTCGITFSSVEWRSPQTMNISVIYDNSFSHRTSLVSLKANSRWPNDIPDIWKDVVVPPVSVTIRDQDTVVWNTRCKIQNDPYYRTFDNFFRFIPINTQGEFIAFRHKTFPIAVHLLHEECNRWLTCTCGVAIQAGQDTLTWVGCGDVYRIFKQFRMRPFGCFNSGMRVEEISDSRHYKVYLPNGMYVELELKGVNSVKWLDTNIYATPDDANMVEGMCGNMDGDPTNDVTSSTVEDFRVSRDDSLFYGEDRIRKDWSYPSVCSCQTQTSPTGILQGEVTCSNRRTTASCSVRGKDVTEVFTGTCRQTRDLSLHDLDEEWPDFKLDENFIPPAPEWTNGWTLQSATEHCTRYIQNSEVYKRCNGLMNVTPDVSISMCVDMIHVTGDTSFSEATLEAYKSDCQDQVSRNSSLWTSVPGQPSVFDSIMELMCTDNCNGCGTCVKGVCQCSSGYRGGDCGLDITKPPGDLILPQNGLCDIKQKPCQQTRVFGSGFIDLGNFGYKAEVIQVTRHSRYRTGRMKTREGMVLSRNEAHMTFDPIDTSSGLKDLDTPSVVGYQISVTNNGHDYGGEVLFLPYDPTCFSCIGTGSQISCEIKAGYCSINHTCIKAGTPHDADGGCLGCNPQISAVSWSSSGCIGYPPLIISVNRRLIIGLVVPCILLLAGLLIFSVIKCAKRSQTVCLVKIDVKGGEDPPPPYSSRPPSILSVNALINNFVDGDPQQTPPPSTTMSGKE